MICGEHFEGLQSCPECNISLEGCTTFYDDRIESSITSTKKLDEMFEKHKNKDLPDGSASSAKKRGKQKIVNKIVKNVKKLDIKKQETPEETSSNTKKKRVRKVSVEFQSDEENEPSKENKLQPNQTAKSASKNRSKTANTSFMSSASSKINKAAEKRNKKGETMLHVACRLGHVDKVTELLNQGANTNTKDNAGWTPLHEVVQNGRLDLVKLLLQYNTLIDVPGPSNETPLHEAVRYGYKDIAEELVKNGADVNARNCKAETPLQLASGEMKATLENAADNIIQTQSVNITYISQLHSELDFDDIRVYCVSQFRTVHNKLKTLAKHHSNLRVEAKLTKDVTHLIVDAEDSVCPSSLDVLQGIVLRIWVLTTEWVTKCTEDKLEQFDKYEVSGVGTKTNNGPRNSRFNKYKQHPGIFDGCHFYLHNFNTQYEISKSMVVTKAILSKLITDADGVVLRRVPNPESIPDAEKLVPYHARKDGKLVNCSHYIIFKDMYEPMYNMQHLKALPIGWLIECIEKYELCEPW